METLQQTLINEGINYLNYAEGELSRPKEDVVPYCACHFTRKSVDLFLKAFLLSKKRNQDASETLEELYHHCTKLDPQFSSIDINCFSCKHSHKGVCDEKYCLSVDHINECFDKATKIKSIVLGKIKASSPVGSASISPKPI